MRVQRCTTPGTAALVIEITGTSPVPNSASSTAPTAADEMQCAHGYSGCSGVSSSGNHSGTASVASLPSMSARRIAVIGRQNAYAYLASNTATNESMAATFAIAKSLARSTGDICRDEAKERTTGFHAAGPVIDQKRASSVCAAVRWLLSLAPRRSTSAKSRAQRSLVNFGGGAGLNCAPDCIDHGSTSGHSEETGKLVGTYT